MLGLPLTELHQRLLFDLCVIQLNAKSGSVIQLDVTILDPDWIFIEVIVTGHFQDQKLNQRACHG